MAVTTLLLLVYSRLSQSWYITKMRKTAYSRSICNCKIRCSSPPMGNDDPFSRCKHCIVNSDGIYQALFVNISGTFLFHRIFSSRMKVLSNWFLKKPFLEKLPKVINHHYRGVLLSISNTCNHGDLALLDSSDLLKSPHLSDP